MCVWWVLQVVKELFKELRVVQHFARGFLECTQARWGGRGVFERPRMPVAHVDDSGGYDGAG